MHASEEIFLQSPAGRLSSIYGFVAYLIQVR